MADERIKKGAAAGDDRQGLLAVPGPRVDFHQQQGKRGSAACG